MVMVYMIARCSQDDSSRSRGSEKCEGEEAQVRVRVRVRVRVYNHSSEAEEEAEEEERSLKQTIMGGVCSCCLLAFFSYPFASHFTRPPAAAAQFIASAMYLMKYGKSSKSFNMFYVL